MSRGQLKAVWAFYGYFFIPPLLLSLLCCYLYLAHNLVFEIIMIKLASGLGIRYFIITLQGSKLFYYYNLHISKAILWVAYFLIDTLILFLSLCMIQLVK